MIAFYNDILYYYIFNTLNGTTSNSSNGNFQSDLKLKVWIQINV